MTLGSQIMLSCPTRASIRWETVMRLEEIRDRTPGLRPIVWQPGNLSVAQTRNRIVKQFMASECETLVMVDDDVVPPPHALEALGALLPEFGVAAIPHPMRHPDDASRLILTAFNSSSEGWAVADLIAGVNEVGAVATGCVAIGRRVLEALGPAPFRIAHDPDAPFTSDDLLFCEDVRAAGFRIASWFDGWHCDHVSATSLAPLLERSSAWQT